MTHQVIEQVLQGQVKDGWVVLRYRFVRGLLKLAVRVVFLALFGTGLAVFLTHWGGLAKDTGKDTGTLVIVGFVGCCTLITLILVLKQLMTLNCRRTNLIVLTGELLVKSLSGRVVEWPVSHRTQFTMRHETGGYHFPPDRVFEMTEKKTGRIIEVARHSVFEGVDILFQILKGRN